MSNRSVSICIHPVMSQSHLTPVFLQVYDFVDWKMQLSRRLLKENIIQSVNESGLQKTKKENLLDSAVPL